MADQTVEEISIATELRMLALETTMDLESLGYYTGIPWWHVTTEQLFILLKELLKRQNRLINLLREAL